MNLTDLSVYMNQNIKSQGFLKCLYLYDLNTLCVQIRDLLIGDARGSNLVVSRRLYYRGEFQDYVWEQV